jgi:hypothetical protein
MIPGPPAAGVSMRGLKIRRKEFPVMSNLFGLHTRAPVARPTPKITFFRPRLERMEERDVPAGFASAPALLGAPLVNSVNITNIAGDVLQLVANVTTPGHTAVQVPLTLDNIAPAGSTPILDLHVSPIHLNVLGLKVDTSNICLDITAQSGPGNLLGNLLGDISHLLDQGLDIGQILSNLSLTQLTTLSNGLSGVVNGALKAIGSPTNAAAGGASVIPNGSTQILDLSLGPVDLNLLGLRVHLDNCANGPVTVDISAQPGAGNLLGNLIGGLANLLNSGANVGALRHQINRIATDVRALATAAARQLTPLLPLQIASVTPTDVTNNALDLVANATVGGQAVPIPLTLTNTTPNSDTPILNLHVGAIHLNVLGLTVDTSEICLDITAQSGSGNLLGNLLADIAHLLDQGSTFDQIMGSLSADQLNLLNTGMTGLLTGALSAIGSPTNAALGGATVTSSGTTNILNLSLGPVDLNLLGLDVHLDNCANGPVTVAIGAQSGPGNLLGNLIGGLAHLLDSNAAVGAILQRLNQIAGVLDRLL